MKLLIAVVLIAITHSLYAQTDTTFKYYNTNWKECAKDTATYVSKVYAEGNLFKQKDYWIKGMKLQMDATWTASGLKQPTDTATWYNEAGVATTIRTYLNGKTATLNQSYGDGNQKGNLFYDASSGLAIKTGWAADGTEIRDSIYDREAHFPGGTTAWQQYLVSKVDHKLAANENAPVGVYTVKVQFIVTKEGRIERVQGLNVPDACKKCGPAAVKIIANSPQWDPAIQYGRPVIYQAIQYVSWSVAQ